jgi:hypothetical protein
MEDLIKSIIPAITPLLGVLIGFLLSNWQRRIGGNDKKINDFVSSLENYCLGKCKKISLEKTYLLLPKNVKKKIIIERVYNSVPDKLEANCIELLKEINNVWKS